MQTPHEGGGWSSSSWPIGTWVYRTRRKGRQENNLNDHLNGPGGWRLDSISADLVYDGCDIDVVPAASFTRERFMSDYANSKPVLVRGLADEWAARKDGAWSKEKLISSSVNMPINVGRPSTIVAAGGGRAGKKSLRDFIDEMDESNSSDGDALRHHHDPKDVSFDVKFFYENPEFIKDFSNPKMFEQFCNKKAIKTGEAWLIFSLGSSRSGLPFHVHGPTWLGLVFGQKRWFLYPPGSGLSSNAFHEADWHPLRNTMTFMNSTLSKLGDIGDNGPLQCTQLPGDVMYLPAGYKHATLNIGETLAAGCQGVYPSNERLSQCKSVLKQVPNDVECLKGYALGLVAEPLRVLDMGYMNNGIDNHKRSRLKAVEQITQALPIFLRAIELRPGDPETYFLLIELLITIDDVHQAREVVRRAAKQFSRASLPADIPDKVIFDIQLTISKHMRSLHLDEESQQVLEHDLAPS